MRIYRITEPEMASLPAKLVQMRLDVTRLMELLQNAEGFRSGMLGAQLDSLCSQTDAVLTEAMRSAVPKVRAP